MKTIEEFLKSYKIDVLDGPALHKLTGALLVTILQDWEQQQVSIAVEKYKKRLLESGLNNDFDVLAAQTQILEELKGGEGER